jgi:hypothetical protein
VGSTEASPRASRDLAHGGGTREGGPTRARRRGTGGLCSGAIRLGGWPRWRRALRRDRRDAFPPRWLGGTSSRGCARVQIRRHRVRSPQVQVRLETDDGPTHGLVTGERGTPSRAVPPLVVKRAIGAGHEYLEPVRTPRRDVRHRFTRAPGLSRCRQKSRVSTQRNRVLPAHSSSSRQRPKTPPSENGASESWRASSAYRSTAPETPLPRAPQSREPAGAEFAPASRTRSCFRQASKNRNRQAPARYARLLSLSDRRRDSALYLRQRAPMENGLERNCQPVRQGRDHLVLFACLVHRFSSTVSLFLFRTRDMVPPMAS